MSIKQLDEKCRLDAEFTKLPDGYDDPIDDEEDEQEEE